jgi:alkaline phosphatase D
LAAKPGFRKLKASCPILATWDDHDYGTNDLGGEHPNKKQMQKVFLDFFEEPADSPVRRQEGIYQAAIYGPPGKRVQVILFDSRYHRGPLKGVDLGRGYQGYLPGDDPTVPLLGEAQWQWFEKQIQKPAEVRLIVSSIQVLPDSHPLEKWNNLPHERERLFATIRDAKLAGVVFLSGDQHLGEISKLEDVLGYDAYELTSSGMTHTREAVPAPNRYRIGRSTREKNFGLVEIDWDKADPVIQLSVRTESGEVQLQQDLKLSQLQPACEESDIDPKP